MSSLELAKKIEKGEKEERKGSTQVLLYINKSVLGRSRELLDQAQSNKENCASKITNKKNK